MLTDRVKELTKQLNQLRIEQDRLRQQEVAIVNAIIKCYKDPVTQTEQTSKGDRKVPAKAEPGLYKQDTSARGKASAKQKADPNLGNIEVGSRVRIKNPKPRAGENKLTDSDTRGIVTRKSKFFIFIKTDHALNKQEVRRARSNVQLLD